MKHNKQKYFLYLILFSSLITACSGGGSESGDGSTFTPCTLCKTFIMAGTTNGNLLATGQIEDSSVTTGVQGADALCMSDFNYPGSGRYKAMVVDGVNRVASLSANAGDGQVDWVLKPNTSYYRADGSTLVMTTDQNALLNFTNTMLSNTIGDNNSFQFWTGLSSDWISSDSCNVWNTAGNATTGRMGIADSVVSTAIDNVSASCDVSRKLLCVEQ